MTDSKFLFMLIATLAGTAVAFQGPMNSTLGIKVKNIDFPTLWSFVAGSIVLLVYFFLIKRYTLPSMQLFKTVPWWAYLGPIVGIIYVFSVVLVIPKLGAGNATVILLLAQTLTAVILDHFGLVGLPVNPINLYKIIGLLLMFAGVIFVNK